MSSGVSDQRMRGQGNQVSNGSREQVAAGESSVNTEEFEPWRNQQHNTNATHAAYGASVPISSGTDLYNMNNAGYYGSGGTYPYHSYGGVGDGTWSNGTDPVTFLGGYPHDSYSMDGMFGPSTTFSTPTAFGQPSSFNYFPNNGDYSTWGNQLSGQRKYEDYYRDPQNIYTQAMPDSSLKGVEHAMQNLDLKVELKETSLGQPKKTTTWASIASQPAKPQLPVQNQGIKKKGPGMPPGPIIPGKYNMDIGSPETPKITPPQVPQQPPPPQPPPPLPPTVTQIPINHTTSNHPKTMPTPPSLLNIQPPTVWNTQQSVSGPRLPHSGPPPMMQTHRQPPPMAAGASLPTPHHHSHQGPQQQQQQQIASGMPLSGGVMRIVPPHPVLVSSQQVQHPPIAASNNANMQHPVLDELRVKNNYNPQDFDLMAPSARFFVIKSYSEDDIHRSIKYEIWCSTEHGNKRLDQAYREQENANGQVFLFFSVNGSGHFCGMAQMVTPVDYNANSSVWAQDKWKGQFKVRWIYVKDVPNVQFRHIRLENNDNKPVTNSRDTQEVPHDRGLQVLRIMHTFRHSTSIFDDFVHYEKRQEEEGNRKQPQQQPTTQLQQQQQQHQQGQQQQQQQQQLHHHHHHQQQQKEFSNHNNDVGGYYHSSNRDMKDGSHHQQHRNEYRGKYNDRDDRDMRDGHRSGGHYNNRNVDYYNSGQYNRDRDFNRGRVQRGVRN